MSNRLTVLKCQSNMYSSEYLRTVLCATICVFSDVIEHALTQNVSLKRETSIGILLYMYFFFKYVSHSFIYHPGDHSFVMLRVLRRKQFDEITIYRKKVR